jgi:hypothetical protein
MLHQARKVHTFILFLLMRTGMHGLAYSSQISAYVHACAWVMLRSFGHSTILNPMRRSATGDTYVHMTQLYTRRWSLPFREDDAATYKHTGGRKTDVTSAPRDDGLIRSIHYTWWFIEEYASMHSIRAEEMSSSCWRPSQAFICYKN